MREIFTYGSVRGSSPAIAGRGIYSICPPSLSAAAEFRISLCEMRRQEFCLIIFILFGSIAIKVITLHTIILPKLYLYDKWKNNQRKH